ncbi:MAG: kelch-like protein [Armatimonadetes bacterium]|nr:kelch-like protein [Armatimonadota bacterium]
MNHRNRVSRLLLLFAAAAVFALAAFGASPLGAQSPPQAPGGAPESALPEVNGWRLGSPMLQARSEHGIAVAAGRMYVVGGYPPGRVPSDVVQVYEFATGRWTTGPNYPVPLHHAMAASVAGKVYIVGGEMYGAGSGRPEEYIDFVYELDLAAGNTWRRRAAMPTKRSGGGAAVLGGRIYVAGGRPPGGSDFAVYDPAADTWRRLPDLPTQRNHLAMAAVDDKIYVIGGRFGAGFNSERTPAVEIYDPATNRWTAGAPMLGPRGGLAGATVAGCIFTFGGEGNYRDNRGMSDETEAYNPRTDSWTRLAPMPTPTHGLGAAAVFNDGIHLPGGSITIGGGTGTVIHWIYRPTMTCSSQYGSTASSRTAPSSPRGRAFAPTLASPAVTSP